MENKNPINAKDRASRSNKHVAPVNEDQEIIRDNES